MGFKIVAIYDEEEYGRKLMGYINKKVDFVQVQVFTSFENIKDFTSRNHISLLFISNERLTNSLKELDIGKVIILTSNREKSNFEEYPSIYKYQSSESLIKELLEYYKSIYGDGKGNQMVGDSQLIGVYSPIKRCLKTSFALALSQVYGQEYTTLYLSLERFSGMDVLLGKEPLSTLSDAMYYFRERREGFIEKLDSMVERIEKIDYIPPVINPEDIENIEGGEWLDFLKTLLNKSKYKIIIIDFGEGIRGIYEILRICNKIYMPIRTDQVSVAKLEKYEGYLEKTHREDILTKTIKIKLNKEVKTRIRGNYIEQLLQGDFIAYVKDILEKEGH